MNLSRPESLDLGRGIPKICIPITAKDIAGLSLQILGGEALPGDLYEWRLDHYSGDVELGLRVYGKATERPLLCTLRTKGQGGEIELDPDEYAKRVRELIELGEYFQLIDIELCAGDSIVKELIEAAHSKGLIAVVSQHSFTDTPPKDEMIRVLAHMKDLGADLPKLAATPKTPLDVFSLMAASFEASVSLGPVITMSMGPIGQLSRVAGSVTGSAVTFGAGAEASAPGQLGAGELKQILDILGRGLLKERADDE